MAVHHDRAMVLDRGSQATYAPEQLGRTQALTPEGYLLCSDVRIARTGAMLYRPDEVPEVRPAANGQMVVIMRDADVLFAPDAIASFNGKPVTNDHPPALLSETDTRKYQIGVVLNPRRGEGVDSEYLMADLLITDAATIALIVAKKKREVSPGYDAELEEVKPGLGRQTAILGNHLAIVDRGRGGSSCAIQDMETNMAKRRKMSLMDRLRAAFRDNDETAFESALADAPEGLGEEPDGDEGGVHVHIHNAPTEPVAPAAAVADENPYEERFKALEDAIAGMGARFDEMAAAQTASTTEPNVQVTDEDPEEDEPADSKEVMDAAAKAEIIFPGYKSGTMDGEPKSRAITDMRRDVLTRALNDSARKAPVEAILAGVDLAASKPAQVRVLFDAAAAVAKAHNTRPRVTAIPQGPMTAALMQEKIAARRAKASGR